MVDILIPILAEAGIENVSVIYGEKRMGDVVRNFSDTNKAKERLDWICNVSLDEGLKLTVCSFLKSLMR
jgi:UDP-glucose 4-epimerase